MQLTLAFKKIYTTITEHKKLFFIGVIIKVVLSCLFASNYLTHLFIPFLKYSTTQSLFGSYTYFANSNQPNAFPYPTAMLLVLALPKWLLHFFGSSSNGYATLLDILSVRITLLLADVVILYILLKWLKKYTKQVTIFYWLSPIILYINYIHGQLDALPVCFLLISLYFLFKNKFILTALFLAIAIGCKTNILLALPFLLIYGYKNSSITKATLTKGIITFTAALLIINIPVLVSNGYLHMVYNNEEQGKLFNSTFSIANNFTVLLVPALYLMLLIRFTGYWQMSKNLLLLYLGFAFGLITVCIAANQGWYYWCLPFFIYFLVKEFRYSILPFILINVFYFLHFALVNTSDFTSALYIPNQNNTATNLYNYITQMGLNAALYSNIVATLLLTSIVGFCYFIYRYGLVQLQQHKMLYQPYLIGIAGDSATGKTTLANSLQQLWGANNSTIIQGDDMHKWERGNTNWRTTTHLNPTANTLHTNMLHTLQFIKGIGIQRVGYNHQTGVFNQAKKIPINRIVVFEGLHSFYLEEQKKLMDLKIYCNPPEAIRVARKIERDVAERGHQLHTVLQSIDSRKTDAELYIKAQYNAADIIVESITDNSIIIKILNSYDVDTILELLQQNNITVQHKYIDTWQLIECTGLLQPNAVASMGQFAIDSIEELGFGEIKLDNNYYGVLQLLIVQVIFYKMQLQNN